MESTVRQEMEVGRRYAPDVAWQTLFLLAGIYVGLAASVYGVVADQLPLWAGALINGVILYGTYTVVHEGVHDNIIPRNHTFKWINMTAAFLAAFPLGMLIYPHRKSHMIHHTVCNTDDDPDVYCRGSALSVVFWHIPLSTLGILNPIGAYQSCITYKVTQGQKWFSVATYALYVALIAGIIHAGYGFELLTLWFLPFLIGYSIMLIFFTLIPHHPHTQLGRYRDTRCSLWPGGNFLTQGQNYHLIHHMMPGIPWYNYERVFNDIRPMMEQNDALIDGFWPRPVEQTEAGH